LFLERTWRQEWSDALAALAAAAGRLEEREQALEPRERALGEAEADLRRRQQVLCRDRAHLEAGEAHRTMLRSAGDEECAVLLAQMKSREDLAASHWRRLLKLRQLWSQRRRQDEEALQEEQRGCAEARRFHAAAGEDYRTRCEELDRQKRAVAER